MTLTLTDSDPDSDSDSGSSLRPQVFFVRVHTQKTIGDSKRKYVLTSTHRYVALQYIETSKSNKKNVEKSTSKEDVGSPLLFCFRSDVSQTSHGAVNEQPERRAQISHRSRSSGEEKSRPRSEKKTNYAGEAFAATITCHALVAI